MKISSKHQLCRTFNIPEHTWPRNATPKWILWWESRTPGQPPWLPSILYMPVWTGRLVHQVLFSLFLVAKLLYKYLYPSVYPSVRQIKGETWFSRPLLEIELQFFLFTFLLYLNIYSINILSVGLSVSLQKAEM